MADDRFDERMFDELLRDTARDYNAPPATPRDAIWARVESARRARSGHRAGWVVPVWRAPAWFRVAAALAATLAIGVAIGRWSGRPAPGELASRAESTVHAPVASVSAEGAGDTGRAPVGVPVLDSAAGGRPSRDLALGAPPGRGETRSRVKRRAAGLEPVVASAEPRQGPDQSARRATYRLAAVQHLSQAEALLISFHAETRAGEVDQQVSVWARDLLTTTRVLLDSPSLADPRMRELLDDLELVLAQIASLRAEREPIEIDLINDAVRQREVLARLRQVVPTGTIPRGI